MMLILFNSDACFCFQLLKDLCLAVERMHPVQRIQTFPWCAGGSGESQHSYMSLSLAAIRSHTDSHLILAPEAQSLREIRQTKENKAWLAPINILMNI